MSKYFIVNADDFNLTEGVSRGIVEGHRHGIITSTTVMVNLPGLARSRDLAREVGGLGLGLHVNLTLGAPALSPNKVPSLVDASGCFVRDRDWVGEHGALSEIRDETAAQARRFGEIFGRSPTHLDTHYHMHRLPRILAGVLDVAADIGVPLRAVTAEMAVQIRLRGVPAVDRMVGDVGPDAYWTAERLRECIRTAEDGVTELMCHPGYADDALSVSSYRAQREGELRGLCDPRVRDALAPAGVELISYRELGRVSGPRR